MPSVDRPVPVEDVERMKTSRLARAYSPKSGGKNEEIADLPVGLTNAKSN
jgi:hypothetical protein